MLPIKHLDGREEPLLNIDGFTWNRKVNGDRTVSFSVYPGDNPGFELVETESSIEHMGEEYIIKQVNNQNIGDTYFKDVEAIHRFFCDMMDSVQHNIHNGSMTFAACMNFIFNGSGYGFNIVDPVNAERFENFGEDTRLSLFQTALERYGMEFEVAGKTVFLKRSIGSRADWQYRYAHNIETIDKQISTHNLATRIRGKADTPDEAGNYPINETYTSPNASIFGIRDAPPYSNENIKSGPALIEALKARIIDEPEISVTVSLATVEQYDQANEGDYGFIFYEPMELEIEARVVEITQVYDYNIEEVIDTEVTLSNFRNLGTDYMTRFNNTSKQLDRIMQGQEKLPYNVLDDAFLIAIKDMQSAQTEVLFENGFQLVEKTNPNERVVLNSKGMFLTRDGGSTLTTAITSRGITANVINAGQLNANNVTIFGGSTENYTNISGNTVEARGRHRHSWFGEEYNEDTRLRLQWGYFIAESMTLDQRLYYSARGISTAMIGSGAEGDPEDGQNETPYHGSGVIEFFSHRYGEQRGLTLSSNRGVLALKTYFRDIILDANRDIKMWSGRGDITMRPMNDTRPGNNEWRWWIKNNDNSSDTDGVLSFGSPITQVPYAVGMRFEKTQSGEPTIYFTNGNGDRWTGSAGAKRFLATDYFEGSLRARSDNVYVMVNEYLRVTNFRGYNDGNGLSFRGIQAGDIHTNFVRTNPQTTGTNFYIGVSGNADGEIRATNLLGYNDGDIGFRPIKAAEFREASSLEYKQNVEPLDINVLPIINSWDIVTYNNNEDVNSGNYHNKQVGLIAELTPELATHDRKAIVPYKQASYLTKGIQELFGMHLEQQTRSNEHAKQLQDQQEQINALAAILGELQDGTKQEAS